LRNKTVPKDLLLTLVPSQSYAGYIYQVRKRLASNRNQLSLEQSCPGVIVWHSMIWHMWRIFVIGTHASMMACLIALATAAAAAPRHNVLLLMIDDLRPELNTFHPWSRDPIITPNLDALTTTGAVIETAIVQFALCAPSRTSLLTSLRPDSTGVWSIGPFFRNTTSRGETAVTLPQAFKAAGWHAEAYGKVFHINAPCFATPPSYAPPDPCLNDEASWSVPAWLPNPYQETNCSGLPLHNPSGPLNPQRLSHVAVSDDVPDDAFPDVNTTEHAIAAIRRFALPVEGALLRSGSRFFLAVGLEKPHLPFVFPKRFADMYSGLGPQQPVDDAYPPRGAPVSLALAEVNEELSRWTDVGNTTGPLPHGPRVLPKAQQATLRLGYHAATTFTDFNVGRVLGALDAHELRESTVIVVVGDHGWKLGEHAAWTKKTNYIQDVRGLLIVAAPGQARTGVVGAGTVVEFIDIYPTIVDLAMPATAAVVAKRGLEGASFARLLSGGASAHKQFGFSQYTCARSPGSASAGRVDLHLRPPGDLVGVPLPPPFGCMAYAVLAAAERLHYIAWVRFDDERLAPDFNVSYAVELYDHSIDPHEDQSVAGVAAYAATEAHLQHILVEQFGRAGRSNPSSTSKVSTERETREPPPSEPEAEPEAEQPWKELSLGARSLTLVEASGVEDALPAGDEWAAAAGGAFCGGTSHQLVLVTRGGAILLLDGPSPHVVGSGEASHGTTNETVAPHAWLAAAALDLDGDGVDELLLLSAAAGGVTDEGASQQQVHVLGANRSCNGLVVRQPPVPLPTAGSTWVGLTTSVSLSGAGLAAAVLQPIGPLLLLQPNASARQRLAVTGEAATPSTEGMPWRAALAVDLDGDSSSELVLARCAINLSDSPAPLVAAFSLKPTTWRGGGSQEGGYRQYELTRVATSTLSPAGGCTWLGTAAAANSNLAGDGERKGESAVLLRTEAPRLVLLNSSLELVGTGSLAPPGSAAAVAVASAKMLSTIRPNRPPADCFDGSDDRPQLVVVRASASATTPPSKWSFRIDVELWAGREQHDPLRCLAASRAQIGWTAKYNESSGHMVPSPVPTLQLLTSLNLTSTDSYKYLIWDEGDGSSYLRLVEILAASDGFRVGGKQLRVWADLIPPSEVHLRCSIPADSPLTPYNELSLFNLSMGTRGCLDYAAWGEALGRLAALFPHLVAMMMDDFSLNVVGNGGTFRPPLIARMTSNARRAAPWLSFVPTVYFKADELFVFAPERLEHLPRVLDAPNYIFRNEKEGRGPCAGASAAARCSVPDPDQCAFCIAGVCGEQTVGNMEGELRDIAAPFAPYGRRPHPGLYDSRHTACGTPTPHYVNTLLPALMRQPPSRRAGTYVFRMAPLAADDCRGTNASSKMACIVAKWYRTAVWMGGEA
jgi:iduronate 2-sulfatase